MTAIKQAVWLFCLAIAGYAILMVDNAIGLGVIGICLILVLIVTK